MQTLHVVATPEATAELVTLARRERRRLLWGPGHEVVTFLTVSLYVSKSYFRLFRAARPRDGGAGAGLGGPGREMKPRADA